MLVDIQARRVEVFRRTPEQDWLFHEYLPGCGDCVFPALGVSIPFDAVFENVNPPMKPPVWMTVKPREGDSHVPARGGGGGIGCIRSQSGTDLKQR